MANGDAPAPAPETPHFDTPYLVQMPDGSTATQTLRTDRPLSTQELSGYVAGQGNTFLGYPDPAATAPPPPAPTVTPGAPPPAPADTGTPAPGEPSTFAQRAQGILLPQRSFTSQLPSVVGATAGAAAAGLTGPAAPFVAPITAAVGSGLGEAGRIAYETVTGATPAEPASAWDRIQNAAIRGGTFEAAAAPVAWAARPVMTALKPVGAAVRELMPVLRQDLPAGVQAVENAATGTARSINQLIGHADPEITSKVLANPGLQLSPESQLTVLRAWWQRNASKAPEEIANAWETLSGTAQDKLAGALREPMQTVINTLKSGQDLPAWTSALLPGAGGAAATAATLFHHPVAGAVLAAPSVVKAAGEAVPYVATRMIQSPGAAAMLGWLPRAAQVAAPLARGGLQSLGTLGWPLATTLAPEAVSPGDQR